MQALSLSNGRIFLCGEQESKGPVQLLSIRQCLAPTLESGAKVESCHLQYIQITYIKNSLKILQVLWVLLPSTISRTLNSSIVDMST